VSPSAAGSGASSLLGLNPPHRPEGPPVAGKGPYLRQLASTNDEYCRGQ